MRYFVLASVVFFSGFLTAAESPVLSGQIIESSSDVSSATLLPLLCQNKSGESYMCSALRVHGVVVKDAAGKQTSLKKLLLPTSTGGGLMGMGPSFSMVAYALAMTPKEDWNGSGYEEYFESAEISDFTYITVPENKISATDSSKELVGLAKLTITLKLKKSLIDEMNAQAAKTGDETAKPPQDGQYVIHMGEGLDLQAIASSLKE